MATIDDFSADSSTTGSIAVGGIAYGVLDQSYDHDWFKFTLDANTTYQITLDSIAAGAWRGGYAPQVQVLSSAGQYGSTALSAISVGKSGTPSIWVKTAAAGTYYIDVSDSGYGNLGAYQLGAVMLARDDYKDDFSSTVKLAAGGQVSGSLELPRDRDAFELSLEAGVTYSFNAAGKADANGAAAVPVIAIYNGSSSYYGSGGSTSSLSYTATTTGKYYVILSDVDTTQGVGGYTLSMSQPADDYAANAAGAGALALGGKQSGKLENSGDIDWFKVSLQANLSYSVQLSGDTSTDGRISGAVVDAQGNSLGGYFSRYSDGTLQLDWTPPRAGDYYVQVSASGGTGSYTVQLGKTETDDYSADRNTTGVLAAGGSVKGRLEKGYDQDWIKVTLQAGTTYTYGLSAVKSSGGIALPVSSFNLVDASGNTLVYGTSSPNGDKVISWKASSSGDYYLAVNASYEQQKADYTVTSYLPRTDAVAGDSSTTASMQFGTVQKDAIDFVGDRDWYKFDAKSYGNYSFALYGLATQGGTFDSKAGSFVLQVVDSSGTVVGNGYSYSGDNEFNLNFYNYDKAGTYYLVVGSSGLNTGSYTLLSSGDGKYLPDIRPPVLQSLSGPNKAGGKGLADNITLSFNETVQLGSGTIKLSLASGTVMETVNVGTSTSVKVSYSNLTLDPLLDLLPDTDYVIELGAGTIKDTAGNANTSAITYKFHTVAADHQWTGTTGNDIFRAGTGNDTIDGGTGIDTVVIAGNSNSFSVSRGPLYTTVSNYYGNSGVTTLSSVERIQFDDRALALDLRGDAGQVYRLYQAAFGRTPDSAGLGYWIAQADKGMSLHDVAQSFVTSKEFQTLYGASPSDAVFLSNLYKNVLHRDADQGGLDYWGGELAHGMQRADVLASFSESTENQLATNSAIQYGISYTPYL